MFINIYRYHISVSINESSSHLKIHRQTADTIMIGFIARENSKDRNLVTCRNLTSRSEGIPSRDPEKGQCYSLNSECVWRVSSPLFTFTILGKDV